MSDKRSDTIITVIGSVKNVGMLPIAPPKNVDHATRGTKAPLSSRGNKLKCINLMNFEY